jgi:hypothetical protein
MIGRFVGGGQEHFSLYFSQMKAASVQEIKQELKEIPPARLVELCLRLARYKKENKELLTYLLFEETDPDLYIKNVKEEMDEAFGQVNTPNLYYAKKTLRKILRNTNKYIRYAGTKTVEIELLMHFITAFRALKLPLHKSTALANLYKAQFKKLEAAVSGMHEDLQYDYLK